MIVYVKDNESDSLSAGGIDFNELISIKGKEKFFYLKPQTFHRLISVLGVDLASLKTYERDLDEVALLPYSR